MKEAQNLPSRAESQKTLRFVTASSLFDGHDASINIMRRILQSSGVEVIHLGHNRSALEIVEAALEEDANGIAISSYQGGHVEFFKYIIDLLKEKKAPHICVFGGGGGTITPDEIADLEKYGVKKIYSPEDGRKLGLQGIIDHMIKVAGSTPKPEATWKSMTDFAKDKKHLSQALSLLEAGEDKTELQAFLKSLTSLPTKGTVIGITGTGGAGKSSLTDELILRILEADKTSTVAVLAIDPTHRKTGGALLGDRLRMNSIANPRTFMRSLATRQQNSAISQATLSAVELLRRANFDWIFVETGGIGQSDTSIVEMGGLNLYVMTAEFGAPTQLEKINMLDYADVIVINKFEKRGSLDALTDVRKQFRRNHREFEKNNPEEYPVFGTIASRFADAGVDALFAHLNKIKSEPTKRQLLKNPFNPDSLTTLSIVPKERTQYLSDISQTVRRYHEETKAQAQIIERAEALKQASQEKLSSLLKEELEKTAKTLEDSLPRESLGLLTQFEEDKKNYSGDAFHYTVRDKKLAVDLTSESLSHTKIRRVVLPQYTSKKDIFSFVRRENLPGFFPYTAGVFPFKRQEELPARQFAGEGTPARTNSRFHLLSKHETAKRLSTAFDSVTLYGQDPHKRPDIYGKIGESGVSICTLDDAKTLYQGFDLTDPNVSVSMTINGPAPMILAFYFNTAIDQEVEKFEAKEKRKATPEEWQKIKKETLKKVRGTVQADILKEDQAQNTCIFSTEFAIKMMGDIQEYFIQNEIRNYYSVSISGYHIAEAGANPITQLALTLANGFTYAEYYLSRGMKIDDFAANFSFFFSNGLDPEYTVIGRVARRIWAIAMRDRYRANDRSQKLKYHVQTSGRSLHAQEMAFNDIRTTLQALIAVFDNCNSLHTNAYDEAVTTPTAESVRRALAIQLVISKEFGWAKNENPLQGSFFIEELTDLVEEAVLCEFERLSQRGGVLGAMETHYQRSKIQEESLYYETLKHSGEFPIIGVNTFENPETKSANDAYSTELTRATYEEKNEQIDRLKAFHEKHASEAPRLLEALKAAARGNKNVFEILMEASRHCSLGQMSQALYETGGMYRRGV